MGTSVTDSSDNNRIADKTHPLTAEGSKEPWLLSTPLLNIQRGMQFRNTASRGKKKEKKSAILKIGGLSFFFFFFT